MLKVQSSPRQWPAFLLVVLLMIVLLLVGARHLAKARPVTTAVSPPDSSGSQLYFPVVSEGNPALLCRFGINAIRDITPLDLVTLRVGWYLEYRLSVTAEKPKGIRYAPVIRLSQVGENGYTYVPHGNELQEAIAAHPGADWYIGNEPDRRDYQDNLEPHVYASAYHELYHLIKGADPTARIFAGTIVQPTPVRLQYLDMVLNSYQQSYGHSMPVDGWSIHNFILNEVSCDYDDTNCWGAEIPPGIDAPFGEVLMVEDNDRVDLFIERIIRFRQWMNARGYGGLPVSLSEYGVLMPDWLGFPPERVNAFMNATFDYLLTATDPQLGDPNDGYRLIQNWSWFSTGGAGDPYNGYLFEPGSTQLSAMGVNFAGYTSQLDKEVDLYPVNITADSVGSPLLLQTQIANSGNLVSPVLATVRFYNGNPSTGGTQIGQDQSLLLSGCGDNEMVEVAWEGAAPGTHQVYVVVDWDNAVAETNEQNNVISQSIMVTGAK